MFIRDLTSTNLSSITNCFNNSFSDYIIQFKATEEYLADRWSAAGVSYIHSFGAFNGKELIGFIIQAIDFWNGDKTAFNVGTGVVPDHRGKRIVKQLFNHAIPLLIKNDIRYGLLEVIKGNHKAIKAYKSVGFHKNRELNSYIYSGDEKLNKTEIKDRIEIQIEEDISFTNWEYLKTFWDFQPSWENSVSSIMRRKEKYSFCSVRKDGIIISYAIINPKTGYIPQFATCKEERRKGYGKYLFSQLKGISEKLAVINVDESSQNTNDFLRGIGFNFYISQYEMKTTFA